MSSEAPFTAKQWLRYSRHLQLPQCGAEGQLKLKQADVVIIGAGGLGSPASLYLAAAGVGSITLVDGDRVELTNLQRQIAFSESDLGQFKAEATSRRLQALNSDIHVRPVPQALTSYNADKLIESADVVVDCTDSFDARYLINDTCRRLGKTWVYASVHQFSGQCSVYTPRSPCYRCLFPSIIERVATCEDAGVLGALPGMLGSIQASEAIKVILGQDSPLEGQLQLIDLLTMQFQRLVLTKDPLCSSCGGQGNAAVDAPMAVSCQANYSVLEVLPGDFCHLKHRADTVLIDVRSAKERALFHLGGLHIPAEQLTASRLAPYSGKRLLLYCQTGARSLNAANRLIKAGHKVISVRGGIAQILQAHLSRYDRVAAEKAPLP